MKVQLSFQAQHLPNVAGFLKGIIDPYARVYLLRPCPESGETVKQCIGQTEVVKNCISPDWTEFFIFDFHIGKPVSIIVDVYHEVRKSNTDKMIGSVTFLLSEIVGSKINVMSKPMKKGGVIIASVEKYEGTGTLFLKIRGRNLQGSGKRYPDPFFEVCRMDENYETNKFLWNNVYRSKVLRLNRDPAWIEAVIDLSTLCDGNLDRPIKINVYHYRRRKVENKMLGHYETTLNEMKQLKQMPLRNHNEKGGKRKGAVMEPGDLMIEQVKLVGLPTVDDEKDGEEKEEIRWGESTLMERASNMIDYIHIKDESKFLDYILGGCRLNLCVAIDFTASNGDPRQTSSLHYNPHDGTKNDYEKALESLATILRNYDDDHKYPVWGFGASFGLDVRNCFNCGRTSEALGLDGVFDAYHGVFEEGLVMTEPTVVTEVIKKATTLALEEERNAEKISEQVYTTLIILTDGGIDDIDNTIAALDEACDAPLSIIFVGIGQPINNNNGDDDDDDDDDDDGKDQFDKLRYLDDRNADEEKRDIVQFVAFSKHEGNEESFTEDALNELPRQLVEYFTRKGVEPKPPKARIIKKEAEKEIEEDDDEEEEEEGVGGE